MRERAHQVPLPILHAEFVNLYPGKNLQGRVQVHRFGKHRGAHGAVRDKQVPRQFRRREKGGFHRLHVEQARIFPAVINGIDAVEVNKLERIAQRATRIETLEFYLGS